MTLAMLYNLLPLLIVAFGIVLSLLLVAWRRSQQLMLIFTLSILGCALLASVNLLAGDLSTGQVTPLLNVERYGMLTLVLVLLSTIVVCLLSSQWLTHAVEVHDEYYILIQLVVLGAGILLVSSHFAALFLGFELLSIALVGLVGYGRNNDFSVETSFKYLILSACASSFMLLGIAFLYSQTGSLSFEHIPVTLPISINDHSSVSIEYGVFYQAGMLLFLVGVAFKLSLAPFHFWTPDVYQGSPLPVTLLLATVSKIAMFVVLLKAWFSQPYFLLPSNQVVSLTSVLAVIAVLSMLVGNILALRQQNIKRLLAYSSIAHMGYLLITLCINSTANIALAWQSALLYIWAYVLATISVFTALALTQTKKYGATVNINQWRGLFWQRPAIALLIIFAMLSFTGIPLTVGFIGKFYLLNIAVQSQQWGLIVALIIGSGIGIYYYLAIIFTLFTKDSEQTATEIAQGRNTEDLSQFSQPSQPSQVKRIIGRFSQRFIPAIVAFSLVGIGVFTGLFPDIVSQLLSVK